MSNRRYIADIGITFTLIDDYKEWSKLRKLVLRTIEDFCENNEKINFDNFKTHIHPPEKFS